MTTVELDDGDGRISISEAEISSRSLFVATPMYGGSCTGAYCRSTIELARRCDALGVAVEFGHVYSESLVPRARNMLADRFLRSQATHLLFVDADIEFSASSALFMLALQSDESPHDVIAGVYPRKNIAWEKIREAVRQGKGDDQALDLRRYAADFVVNLLPGTVDVALMEPVAVAEVGAGFMMIRRATLDRLVEGAHVPSYVPDDLRSPTHDPQSVHAFFDTMIDNHSKRYLSEDFAFCRGVRNAGMQVSMCPWIKLSHHGTHRFIGDPAALAEIDAAASIDRSQL